MRTGSPQVAVCLLLQAGIAATGLLLQPRFPPPAASDERQLRF